jgi:hypothetical protein
MRFIKFLTLSLVGVSFACPPPQNVLEAVKKLNIPIKEIKKVEPYKEIPSLCRAIGVLEKDGIKKEVDFYTTRDGKYLLPFVGKISYEKTDVDGIVKIKITSLRNPQHSFVLGYTTDNIKYYIPTMVPLKKEQPKKVENKNKTKAENSKNQPQQ